MSLDPGELVDDDLYLVLEKTHPADEQRGWPPAVEFSPQSWDRQQRRWDRAPPGQPPPHLGHVWYRVLPAHGGQHLAARACRLLLPLARRHGLEVLRITIREKNGASRRTAELAGAEYVGMVETPAGYEDWLGPVRHKCVYHLGTEQKDGQPDAPAGSLSRAHGGDRPRGASRTGTSRVARRVHGNGRG